MPVQPAWCPPGPAQAATHLLARGVPRPLAVAVALIGSTVLLLGALTLVGETVAGESATLVREFREGLTSIEK